MVKIQETVLGRHSVKSFKCGTVATLSISITEIIPSLIRTNLKNFFPRNFYSAVACLGLHGLKFLS